MCCRYDVDEISLNCYCVSSTGVDWCVHSARIPDTRHNKSCRLTVLLARARAFALVRNNCSDSDLETLCSYRVRGRLTTGILVVRCCGGRKI